MGLDHGLYRKRYVKNWDYDGADKYTIEVRKNGVPIQGLDQSKISHITEDVITWRKSNQIHNWFVENVQDGNDDCGNYYVGRDQLEDLLDRIDRVLVASRLVSGKVFAGTQYKDGKKHEVFEDGKVIKDSSVAEQLLPTTSGFFFGDTTYDEYYYQDLQDTKEALEKALAVDGGDFEYWSSW